MTFREALRWNTGTGNLQRIELTEDDVRDALEREPAGHTDIIVTPSGRLHALLGAVPALARQPHKKKHPKRGLSSYLPSRARACHVEASYSTPVEAADGIRALALSKAAARWQGVVLISVADDLFHDMWLRADLSVFESDHLRKLTKASNAAAVEAFLDDHFQKVRVPAEVEAAYLGESPAAARVRRMITLAAATSYPVLIVGQTGTGKEIVAQTIHRLSRARTGNLYAVNCAAISHDLLESELFGHVKGAFTGAWCDKKGLWEAANDGTLFLDEIGELAPLHQAKILRAIEDRRFYKVGADKPTPSDARIITATNRDLERMVATGRFRKDLYFRLIVFPIRTPALAEHAEDIPVLAQHLWKQIRNENAATKDVPPLPPAVLDALKTYRWPGNVRDLRGLLETMFTIANGAPPSVELVRCAFDTRTEATRGVEE